MRLRRSRTAFDAERLRDYFGPPIEQRAIAAVEALGESLEAVS
jgi:hypothetical protein